jgi:hypothetical protein
MAATSNLDFSIDDLDVTDAERDEALAIALSVIRERATFSDWIKHPPKWFAEMYVLDPTYASVRHRVAFERLDARPGFYKAIIPLMYHHMMIIGRIDDDFGYEDRWCYTDFPDALQGFQNWDGAPKTEPDGWHRHPTTGRRRERQPDGTWREHND